MAIGRGGQNIRLASMLTEYELDVYRDIKDDEEDVDIDEFRDAIPAPIIQKLKDIGCDTAKAVLELQPSELARRTGLEDLQAKKIHLLMEAEFSDAAAQALAAEAEAEAASAAAASAAAADEPAETPAEPGDAPTESDESGTPSEPAEDPATGDTPATETEPEPAA